MRSKTEIETEVPCLIGAAYEPKSDATILYNCFAWAHGETVGWLDPATSQGNYWPPNVPRERTLRAYEAAYRHYGFRRCRDGAPEPGYEKIVIYVDGFNEPSHAARLLPTGEWTSKLGRLEDIEHAELSPFIGPDPRYGEVRRYMRRRLR